MCVVTKESEKGVAGKIINPRCKIRQGVGSPALVFLCNLLSIVSQPTPFPFVNVTFISATGRNSLIQAWGTSASWATSRVLPMQHSHVCQNQQNSSFQLTIKKGVFFRSLCWNKHEKVIEDTSGMIFCDKTLIFLLVYIVASYMTFAIYCLHIDSN